MTTPNAVFCIIIAGLFPPIKAPAHSPIPSSSLLHGTCKISGLMSISVNTLANCLHGTEVINSILFFLKSETILSVTDI